ncbi:ABC transporter permease [Carboxydochorda subterranea]|uniref:Autoinducer 2 import system permease protein LsrC n=1 Tax=Carboxydichorda subterranea TaxID=3109565 RepID=A0ABZ1BVV4_9FIRM|nr:ABC transporter permease [Limnochorda sp. L945t]WRP16793.1 ABC transporter permease [Limnochorda sp. L945t]
MRTLSPAQVAAPAHGSPAAARGLRRAAASTEFTILVVLVAISAVLAWMRPQFLAWGNVQNLLLQVASVAIPAMGMTLVIITAGIDVSVGGILGVSAVLMGQAALMGFHPLVLVLVGLAAGAALGAVNGALVTAGSFPPIIATLATMNLLRALIFGLLGGKWIAGIPYEVRQFALGRWLGIPYPFWVVLGLVAVLTYVLSLRPEGRHLYAVGGNAEAATVAGIRVRRILFAVYALNGMLAGLAGFVFMGRGGLVQTNAGSGLELQAIAATVLGGTSILGGKGTAVGTLLGAFLVSVVRNGLILLNIPALWEGAIIGGLVVAAVVADVMRRGGIHG